MQHQPLHYTVKKSLMAVPLDGRFEKPLWKPIQPLIIGRHMGEAPIHHPKVFSKVTFHASDIYIIFHAEDRFVRAVARKHQDPVCKDSCVEFFFTPGPDLGRSYFNLEINCGGTILFHWNPEGEKRIHVAENDCNELTIAHTLPKIVDPEIKAPVSWSVECRIPFETILKYCRNATEPCSGTIWRANFYKCGDATSHPHWLTWSFVDHPTPKFHMPEYFGYLHFE